MQFVYYQVDKFIILILQQFLEKSVASPSNKYNCSLIHYIIFSKMQTFNQLQVIILILGFYKYMI